MFSDDVSDIIAGVIPFAFAAIMRRDFPDVLAFVTLDRIVSEFFRSICRHVCRHFILTIPSSQGPPQCATPDRCHLCLPASFTQRACRFPGRLKMLPQSSFFGLLIEHVPDFVELRRRAGDDPSRVQRRDEQRADDGDDP